MESFMTHTSGRSKHKSLASASDETGEGLQPLY